MSASTTEVNHCASRPELLIRFALWASGLGGTPLPEQIRERFHVSYATSYRWRNAWCDANGIPIPAPRRDRYPRDHQPGGNRHPS